MDTNVSENGSVFILRVKQSKKEDNCIVDHEDEDSTVLRNFGNSLPVDAE
jgi:hypothetical protein